MAATHDTSSRDTDDLDPCPDRNGDKTGDACCRVDVLHLNGAGDHVGEKLKSPHQRFEGDSHPLREDNRCLLHWQGP